jgi:hypothetical protein
LERANPEEEAVLDVDEPAAAAAPDPEFSVVEVEVDASEDAAAGAAEEATGATATEDAAVPVLAEPLEAEPPRGVPGEVTRVFSCTPLAMGPAGLAAQLPAGESGALNPNGIVSVPPTATPPTKVV